MTRKDVALVVAIIVVAGIVAGLIYDIPPKDEMILVKFYDDEGNSNEEIYEISLAENLEEALQKKSTINVGIENYSKLVFSETALKFEEASDPFLPSNHYIKRMSLYGYEEVANRQVLTDLSEIVGRFVLMTFRDAENNCYYSVVKIE